MSGGEQQRVAIARALANRPQILLGDEPTGNLDDESGLRLMNLFDQLNRMGTTVVIASHNTALMERFPHKKLLLGNGQVILESQTTNLRTKIRGAV